MIVLKKQKHIINAFIRFSQICYTYYTPLLPNQIFSIFINPQSDRHKVFLLKLESHEFLSLTRPFYDRQIHSK